MRHESNVSVSKEATVAEICFGTRCSSFKGYKVLLLCQKVQEDFEFRYGDAGPSDMAVVEVKIE